MRVILLLSLSLASFLLAGAAELNMRDPLAYPNMLSAPLGKYLSSFHAADRQQFSVRAYPAEPCCVGLMLPTRNAYLCSFAYFRLQPNTIRSIAARQDP